MPSKLIHGNQEDISFGSFPQTYLLLQSLCFWSQFDVVHSFEVQFDVRLFKIKWRMYKKRDVIRNLPSGKYLCLGIISFLTVS